MDRGELYTESMRWQSVVMMVYDIETKLDRQRREMTETERELQQKKNELPENILREYEQLRVIDRLKQP